MNDNIKFRVDGRLAIAIQDPTRVLTTYFSLCDETQAEKRRDKIIWKVRRKIAFWNNLIAWLLIVLCSLVVIGLVVLMAYLFNGNPLIVLSCCYTGFQLIRLIHVLIEDVELIKFKHRGKIY